MALGTRGKTVIGILSVLVLLGGTFVGYRLLTREEGEPIIDIPLVSGEPEPCPLTGLEADDESLLERRVLAVKIENSPEARPQMGLAEADVIYEQEAEGGISRFIVVYHCRDADRIGPIRSARPVDPVVLQQYGDPLFAHAGSAGGTVRALEEAEIEQINCNFEEETCPRDESREAPHDVFTSTEALRDFGESTGDPPADAFAFDEEVPDEAGRGRQVNLNFSPVANVFWKFRSNQDLYLRFHDDEMHRLEDGSPVTAANVVVLLVDRELTNQVDVAGNPVPTYDVLGRGDLLVFRNGRVIEGEWRRESEEGSTELLDRRGNEIPLAPGQTWVELFPTDAPAPPEF
ncbi:MAG TPA: DUF3048 domain-containing protein [Actinomycetota bacterium]|nr:DUF3048 domain-containing protein [Actinomycetota bacterium]